MNSVTKPHHHETRRRGHRDKKRENAQDYRRDTAALSENRHGSNSCNSRRHGHMRMAGEDRRATAIFADTALLTLISRKNSLRIASL